MSTFGHRLAAALVFLCAFCSVWNLRGETPAVRHLAADPRFWVANVRDAVTGNSVITTAAGTDWLFRGNGQDGREVPLSTPLALRLDANGNLLIADTYNHQILRLNQTGTVTVVAGNGLRGYSGDNDLAVNASFSFPYAAVTDSVGNIFISDSDNHVIRKVTADGIVTVFAGQPRRSGFSGDGGPAARAALSFPAAMTFDRSGNLYFLDYDNRRIRRITPAGIISTYAGNGVAGFSGDGGPAIEASIYPENDGLVLDQAGNLYFSDFNNHRIRWVNSEGIIRTFAGTGTRAFGGDGGPATAASFNRPSGLALDGVGNLYVADYDNHRVRRITRDGTISTIAGSTALGFGGDGGPATEARLRFPVSVAVDSQGNLFIADRFNHRVRRVAPNGEISTIVGNGEFRPTPDGSRSKEAFLFTPRGLVFDRAGNLLVSDRNNEYIRRIAPDGTVSVVAGTGANGCCNDGGPATRALISAPAGIVIDRDGNIFFAEYFNHRVRRVDSSGKISTYAGNGDGRFAGDNGPATSASLNNPDGLAVDDAGNLYIADYFNSAIRRVGRDGVIRTIAGNGTPGFSGDGSAATSATLRYPRAVALNAQGELLIADSGNNRIRLVSLGGTISTICGDGRAASLGDGGPARLASLNAPSALAFDAEGNLYLIERDGHRVRKVDRSGNVSTVAGTGAAGFSGDGGAANMATLNNPDVGLAVDTAGNLYFSDSGNDRIRVVMTQVPSVDVSTRTIDLSASSGGAVVQASPVHLMSSLVGLPFNIRSTPPQGERWLGVTPTQGAFPADLNISADPTNLGPGTYQESITVSAPLGAPSTLTLNVRLRVDPALAPELRIARRNLSFWMEDGDPAASQQLVLENVGGGMLEFTAGVSSTPDGEWLSVTPASGAIRPATPVSLTVTVNPTGLGSRTYTANIRIVRGPEREVLDIPVNLTLSRGQREIVVSQTGLTFTAVEGGTASLPHSFAVLNGRPGTLDWQLRTTTLSGGPAWLKTSAASGRAVGGSMDIPLVEVAVDATGLTPGEYYGRIEVSSPGTLNSPQFLSVLLNVLPRGSRPGPDVRPAGLIFTGVAGSSPSAQIVSLIDPGNPVNTYVSGRLTEDGRNWLVHAPVTGALPAGQSERVVVQPDYVGLGPGIRRGVITVLFGDGSIRTVSVLTVAGAAPSSTRSASGCAPTTLLPTTTSIHENFVATVSQAVSLQVRVVNDCGEPMTTGAVLARFSNGDAQVNLRAIGSGNWSGTWQPVRPGAVQVKITALYSDGAVRLAGEAERSGTLRDGGTTPFVRPDAIQHGASFAEGLPIAPGTWITIKGAHLAEREQVASNSPLPMTLGGTEVLLGGRSVPLLYTSDGQVNAQVPYDLPADTEHQILVRRGASLSVPQRVSVAQAQPAIFTKDQSGRGQGVILLPDGRFAEPGSPAQASGTVVIYAAGLGSVSPTVPAGQPAPAEPLSMTLMEPQITIGGVAAQVQFSGLAPGLVGVYQLNVSVPEGVQASDEVPVLIMVGGQIGPPVTMAVR